MDYRNIENSIIEKLKNRCDEFYFTMTVDEIYELNFERSHIILIRKGENISVNLSMIIDRRIGKVKFNDVSNESIESSVMQCIENAKSSPEDDDYGSEKEKEELYFNRDFAKFDKEELYDRTDEFIKETSKNYPSISFDFSSSSFYKKRTVFCNSYGRRLESIHSFYDFSVVFMGKKGDKVSSFNYTDVIRYDLKDPFLYWGTVERLIKEAEMSFKPQSLDKKFRGKLLITPDAASFLFSPLLSSLNGYAINSNITPYKDKKGEKIASDKLSFYRSVSEEFPWVSMFDEYGSIHKDTYLIEKGLLKNYAVDLYMSKKIKEPVGGNGGAMCVSGGTKTLNEIINGIDRGVMLVRFSGGQPNNNLDFSGVAKNSFYIEDGEIKFALKETMISGNFQEIIKNIIDISQETVNTGYSLYPYILVDGANIV